MEAEVELAVLPTGFAKPEPGRETVRKKIADLAEAGGGNFHWSALTAVAGAIVRELNARNIIACYVMIPELSSDGAHTDNREDTTEMTLQIVTGVVSKDGIRTIARGDRLAKLDEKLNPPDAVHDRIRRQSTLARGELVNSKDLDDYIFRLNRHPGRRVDVALSAGEAEGEVNVDYLVSENKPWSLYAQISNTGTESTNEWRERFGFVHNQLTGNDDIFRLDYITGGFQESHAVNASYQFPLISDRLWVRPYVGWSEFEASELGSSGLDFYGANWTVGGDIIYNVYQHRQLFVDLVAGVRSSYNDINQDGQEGGKGQFILPSFGVRMERFTETMATVASANVSGNVADWSDPVANEVNGQVVESFPDQDSLGRNNVDEFWTVFKWESEHSMFLEPLFNSAGWRGETQGGPRTLAHEISFTFRGQYSPGERLPPVEQDVAGGFYSVRGFPESATAGDTVVIGSAEYRFHVPRALNNAEPGTLMGRRVGLFGQDFRWVPQTDFGGTDWDLILRGFLDAASVYTARRNADAGEDAYDTLWGAGVGMEVQIRRNFTARVDLGFVLKDVDEVEANYEAGDSQWHISATLLY
jgi:hemolysin activation/secretion protein